MLHTFKRSLRTSGSFPITYFVYLDMDEADQGFMVVNFLGVIPHKVGLFTRDRELFNDLIDLVDSLKVARFNTSLIDIAWMPHEVGSEDELHSIATSSSFPSTTVFNRGHDLTPFDSRKGIKSSRGQALLQKAMDHYHLTQDFFGLHSPETPASLIPEGLISLRMVNMYNKGKLQPVLDAIAAHTRDPDQEALARMLSTEHPAVAIAVADKFGHLLTDADIDRGLASGFLTVVEKYEEIRRQRTAMKVESSISPLINNIRSKIRLWL